MSGEPVTTVVGNLVRDPEMRFLPNGTGVASFTVASTPRTKQGDQWVDGETWYVPCQAWRDLGEHVVESLQQGTRVVVTGRLRARSWEKDGQKRTVVELDVEEIGPSLRYATASVRKAERGGGGGQRQVASEDPWASAGSAPF